MGVLTQEQKREMRMAHGHDFEAVCDAPDCGKLIRPGELYAIIRKVKRPDGMTFLSPIITKCLCMACDDKKHGRVVEKEDGTVVKKKSKKQPVELSAAGDIHPGVRRNILRILKASEQPVPTEKLVAKIKRKKKYAGVKVSVFKKTLKAMKANRELKRTKKAWVIRKQKTKRVKKVKVA